MGDDKQKPKSANAKSSSDAARAEDARKDAKVVKVKKEVKKEGDGQAGRDNSVKVKKEVTDSSVKVKKEVMDSSAKVKKELSSGGESGKDKAVKIKRESFSETTVKGSKGISSPVIITKKQSKKLEVKKGNTKLVKVEEKEKQKKVYELPGQKHDPPEERDPLRIFYESLHEQIPNSEMAEVWMMEHGLLPKDVAKKAYDRKLKRQQQQKLGSPLKPSPSKKQSSRKVEKMVISNGKSKSVVTKVSKVKQEDHSDDEFLPQPKKRLKLEK